MSPLTIIFTVLSITCASIGASVDMDDKHLPEVHVSFGMAIVFALLAIAWRTV